MANGEIKNENMLTAFKELHKIVGMDSSYLYAMLVDGTSAEELMRQSVAETQYGGDEEGDGGGPIGGMRLPDFEGSPEDDAFADDLISYGKMMEDLTSFSEAYPIKGKEAVDPYIEYLQQLMDDMEDTNSGDEGDPNNPLQPFGFSWLGSTKEYREDWETDMYVAKYIATYQDDILPDITRNDLDTKQVHASLKRLQNLLRLGDPNQDEYRDAVQSTRPWLRIGPDGFMVPGTPGAEEFNTVMEQVRNASRPDELGGSPMDDLISWVSARLDDELKLDGAYVSDQGKRMMGGRVADQHSTDLTDLTKKSFDVQFRDQSNRALFMNELNKIPGSGTFEMEQNKEGMWQQAETVYLLGEGAPDVLVEGGRITPNFTEDKFVPWAQSWFENPKKIVEDYDRYRKEGHRRGDPQGLALKAHENAVKMMELEKNLESVSVGNEFYDVTTWMRHNPNLSIEHWYQQMANKAVDEDVLARAPRPGAANYSAWMEAHRAFKEAYETQLGDVAGLFHPEFSGSSRRWRSLYTVPNTIGMTPRAANAISRQLNIIANTMRESGMTHGEIAERLTRHSMGVGLEAQAKETGQEWAQGPIPTNMESADTEAQVSAPAYQKATTGVSYAGDPLDTDPEFMTPRTTY